MAPEEGDRVREYVSLLRGINVGGKTLKMDGLLKVYESLGLRDVKSYIQSGNVLFNAKDDDAGNVKEELQNRIRSRSGLEVTVIMRNRREIRRIIERNPFIGSGGGKLDRMYVTFLDEDPKGGLPHDLRPVADTNDDFRVIGTEIYLYCPGGYGKTVFSNSYFEKKLGVRATTRNWKTVTELNRIANEPDTR
jgi:uncharacterized protein (DUF1697 family)